MIRRLALPIAIASRVFRSLDRVADQIQDRIVPVRKEFRRHWPHIAAIDGLLVPGQELWLFQQSYWLHDGGLIVEIGSYKGRSTACLAFACVGTRKRVIAIDTFDGNDTDFTGPGRRGFFREWQTNMAQCGLAAYVTPMIGTSESIGSSWTAPIDFLFIDGSHQYMDVRRDFDQFFPYVRKGGLVAFHDVGSHDGPTALWPERKHLLEGTGHVSTLAYGHKI